MPQFSPIRFPFDCTGVDLVHPPDRMPPGKYPCLNNVRSVFETTLTARAGYGAPLNATPFDQQNVHSVRTMTNSLPGASPTLRRFVGAGTKLYSVDAGLIDTGYSGNPLSLVKWRPTQSVEPWLYVGDSSRMQKCRMNAAQTHYNVGITPPTTAPVCSLTQPFYKEISDFLSVSGFVSAGTAGAASSVSRATGSPQIGVLYFDTPSVGWVNIVPQNSTGDFSWLGLGMLLTFSQGIPGSAEEVVVQETHLQVANSTILGIQYDVGNTGLCTIQAAEPLAGLDRNSMMGLDTDEGTVTTNGTDVTLVSGGPFLSVWAGKTIVIDGVSYTILTVNSGSDLTLTTSAGVQTSVLFSLGDTEIKSVLSYTIGPDGLYSFRMNLQSTHVVGETLQGFPSFRCFTTVIHEVGEPITATAIQSTVSAGTGTLTEATSLDLTQCSPIVGGGGTAGRPLTPDDFFHISLRVNNPLNITQILVQLDVDATTNNFTQNYYTINVQQNLSQALLTGGESGLATLESAAQATLINEVIAPTGGPGFAGAAAAPNLAPGFLQLFAGDNAWTEILIPLAQLTRVGDDTTRSLANVKAIQLLIQATGSVVFQASSWYVGGGYGCNTGLPTAQYLNWRYRYRSSLTGAKSQQSPGLRTGVQAYRQQGTVTPTVSSDPQVDWIDIERFGGVLNEFHYVGSVPNNASYFPFLDTYADDDIKTAPALETDQVMPFPSFDVPKTGTCNVVGTEVAWTSGDQFNPNWAPGQEILINGIAYIVFGQPTSATLLTTVENVGVLTGVPFVVAEPTLIGQPLPHIIGPFDQGNFLLAWGDPRNPGVVYATKGNDPDAAPIPYYLELSDPSEPIVGGVIYDNNAIVASNKRFWRISIDDNAVATGQGNVLVKQELNVGRGLFSPWAICAGPAMWFLDETGVPCETTGGPAISMVENDLRPIFPHDGALGVVVTT